MYMQECKRMWHQMWLQEPWMAMHKTVQVQL